MNNKKRIVILTAPHPYKAAGIVAGDLMKGLSDLGHTVVIVTNARLGKKHPNIISLKSLSALIISKVINKIKRNLYKTNNSVNKYYMYGIKQNESTTLARKIIRKVPFTPDVYIYLFPQFFLSIADLHFLNEKTKAPILWYMMDMAPMTGGCHYAWDCDGFTKKCGKCPGIMSEKEEDVTYKNWQLKNHYIEKTNIIPVAASEYQFMQLQRSSLFRNKSKFKVLLPIDNNVFKNGDKNIARQKLGLPIKKKIVFMGSVSILEERKGSKQLFEALQYLENSESRIDFSELHLCFAGHLRENGSLPQTIQHSYLGFLDYENLALAFQASDVFVCPSIEDSGPMMINQSIMCGTPVVAFEMGVALDLVITGQTGYRAKLAESEDLAKGIEYVVTLKEKEYKLLCDNCLMMGNKLCNPIAQVQELIKLFN